MTSITIKTSSWFTTFPDGHLRVGISRGQPRNAGAGYRMYRKLAPGPWFHSVSASEYYRLYQSEILAPLDPREVASELIAMAQGRIPVLVCFEAPSGKDWCHRAMAAEWLAAGLGRDVPELGAEHLCQHDHPLMPAELRRPRAKPPSQDVARFIGRSAAIDGDTYLVVSLDPDAPGRAMVAVGDRTFSMGAETLARHFK